LACAEYSSFINRFEFCDLFKTAERDAYKRVSAPLQPTKTLLNYFNEEKIELTDNEHQFLLLVARLTGKNDLNEEDKLALKQMEETSKAFNDKHKDQIKLYIDKYIIPFKPKPISQLDIWRIKDSILVNVMDLKPNLTYEIAKIRSLKFSFKYAGQKEHASELWTGLQSDIKNPYFLSLGNAMLIEAFPEKMVAALPLPEGIATDIFRRIIEPHKGKILFIDFWATSCGPCIAGIKRMKETREKYAGNPDFDFVFITDEGGSPEQNYNAFVKEQELKNIYRLKKDEFNYLRQLFKFNGIPRYIVIAPNGDVINGDFEMHNFEHELKKLLASNKK
jgi:thiol-disulfide isomerase/thioredoxin